MCVMCLEEPHLAGLCSSVGRVLVDCAQGPGFLLPKGMNWAWRCLPIVLGLEKWRKVNWEFEVTLYYAVSLRPAWAV